MRYPWQPLLVVAMLSLGPGCLRNIPQSSSSGKDAKTKGAKAIEIEDGKGRAKDTITYPGGDRIDWKVFELPEGKKGRLRVRVKYRTARPGMAIAFHVYDEYFDRVARANTENRRSRKRTSGSKSVKIKNAKGKYYVVVYAPERMDAAKYTVSVRFKETKPPPTAEDEDLLAEIDEPPDLPQVPKPPPPPDPVTTQPVATGPAQPTGPAPPPVPAAEPVKARIIGIQSSTDGVIVVLNQGERAGVQRGANAQVLLGDSDAPLVGGDFKIINVNKSQSVGKIKSIGVDQVKKNKTVLISPP